MTAAATANVVGFCPPGSAGSSVSVTASFVPLPSASYAMVPWLVIGMPTAVPSTIVAVIVIVTELFAAIEPLQVTVFVPIVATAVPLVAVADTRASCAGSTSVNSLPGLSIWPKAELFESTTV